MLATQFMSFMSKGVHSSTSNSGLVSMWQVVRKPAITQQMCTDKLLSIMHVPVENPPAALLRK